MKTILHNAEQHVFKKKNIKRKEQTKMKNLKKLTAILIAVLMVFSMVCMVGAAETDTTYELFVKNDAPNHTYDAYQIFGGDLSADGTTLSNIVWGSSIADPEALVNALTTDTKEIKLANSTTTLKDVFITLTSDTNAGLPIEKKAALVADVLGTISNDSATLDRFAELVGEVNYAADGTFANHTYLGAAVSTSGAQTTNDEGANGYAISNLPAGYYLIKDRDNTVAGNEGDFYTKYMVRVVKSDTITVKGQGVTVTKTVNDTIDGTYTEYEDANINDDLFYKWEGTLPNNLMSYDTYNYKFIDTMDNGLTLERIEKIYIENTNGTVAHTIYDADVDATLPAGVVFTEPVDNGDGTSTFSLEIVDLLVSYPNILPAQKVIVKYSTYLNRDAELNDSVPNEVKVEYDNNPNGEGTGVTVPDEAYAFTFKVDIDKYDAADNTIKLEGVEFVLYYRDTVEDTTTYHYAQVITEEMVEAGETINGKVVEANDVGVIYGFTTDRDAASILDTDANGAINLKGLDAGIYYLEETKTNDGYNLLDTPVQVTITPAYTVTDDDCAVTVKYEVDGMDQGTSATVGVRNSKGSTLPSTGGIGTTIFYIAGAVLVLSAGLVLITKKRLANEQ